MGILPHEGLLERSARSEVSSSTQIDGFLESTEWRPDTGTTLAEMFNVPVCTL